LAVADLLPYAQLFGTFAAAAGLFISAGQFWRNRKAMTLQHLQDFLKSVNERESALDAAAGDSAKKKHAFVEYLNFLEVYSAAANDGLFIGVARELVCDKILDSLVVIQSAPECHQDFQESISSSVTYSHIRSFLHSHRKSFDERKTVAERASQLPAS